MHRTLSALSFGFLALASAACLPQDDVSSTAQDIKGKNKLFATQRPPHNAVAVFDQDGERKDDLTGDGLSVPFGIHVEGDDIYVVSQGNNAVYAHLHDDGEHGAARNRLEVLVPSGSGGLSKPFYPTVHEGLLYVSSFNTDEVLRYDAHTGDFIDAFVAAGAGGVDGPRGVDFDSAGNLYVASSNNNRILVYDASGAYSHELANGVGVPCGISISGTDQICAGSAAGTGVHCFEVDGTSFYASGTGGVCGLDFGRDGNLYNSRPDIGIVEVHDFSGSVGTFANVPMIAGVSWGTHAGE